jgi:hypothetical protein
MLPPVVRVISSVDLVALGLFPIEKLPLIARLCFAFGGVTNQVKAPAQKTEQLFAGAEPQLLTGVDLFDPAFKQTLGGFCALSEPN